MTTKVIIEPAGHRLEVVTVEKVGERDSIETRHEVMEDGPNYSFYIHSTREVTIREIPVPTQPASVSPE